MPGQNKLRELRVRTSRNVPGCCNGCVTIRSPRALENARDPEQRRRLQRPLISSAHADVTQGPVIEIAQLDPRIHAAMPGQKSPPNAGLLLVRRAHSRLRGRRATFRFVYREPGIWHVMASTGSRFPPTGWGGLNPRLSGPAWLRHPRAQNMHSCVADHTPDRSVL